MVEEKKKLITLQEEGIYLFQDNFTAASCKAAIEFILVHNIQQQKVSELKLMICSYGGSLADTFALVDVMRGSTIPITTVGLGVISSCGIVTFMTGHRRILTPNTSILSHQFSWGSWGKEHELFARVREFELTQTRMIEHYKKCTGLKEKEIRKYLLPAEDVWLSAEEAVKYGVADEIKETY